MIPGSHNSGAIREFSGYFASNIVHRYSVNQEESITNQVRDTSTYSILESTVRNP